MKMTPGVLLFGCLVIFASAIGIAFYLPLGTMPERPSAMYRERAPLEVEGRRLYIANGCSYCHTQYIRNIDWGLGAERVAEAGDYISDSPHQLGSERTGPDISQAGGEHPDDWHAAHFVNPRFTRPESLMPPWVFLGGDAVRALTAYVQSLGFKNADFRVDRQQYWKEKAVAAFNAGVEENVAWIHGMVPQGWRDLKNPYPTTVAGLARGHRIYQSFCIGCHGPVGDGMGPAAPYLAPPPLNFTTLKGRGISGGILYYQIMNGITGTSMPYFKRDLESEKIWDVGNYVAVYFIGDSDAGTERGLIDASFVGRREKAP